jgi:hypothetical protein
MYSGSLPKLLFVFWLLHIAAYLAIFRKTNFTILQKYSSLNLCVKHIKPGLVKILLWAHLFVDLKLIWIPYCVKRFCEKKIVCSITYSLDFYTLIKKQHMHQTLSRVSVVGIVTRYGLVASGGEIFRARPDQPWGPPGLLNNGYNLPGVKAWR